MRIWVRGDTHGNFDFLPYFCEENHTTKEDILIIAGDSGILFYGALRAKERYLKEYIQKQPITLLCVRGNHDDRPQNRVLTGMIQTWDDRVNGEVFVDPSYPDCLFALDGGEYCIGNKTLLTIGGAYSVDKYYRLAMHWTWFADEQLTEEEQEEIIARVKDETYDYVITHTCPLDWEPTWLFLNGIDQEKVEKGMELFLQKLRYNIHYGHWYFGHYHSEHEYNDENATLLYNNYVELEI